jgi:ribosomal protein L4
MLGLMVEYKGLPEFIGKKVTIDQKIERAVGKKNTGSGYCFPTRMRDLSFTFRKKEKVEAAKKAVAALAKKEKIKIKCSIFKDW